MKKCNLAHINPSFPRRASILQKKKNKNVRCPTVMSKKKDANATLASA